MDKILMRLGQHEFTIDLLNYQKFSHEYEARWKEHYTAGGSHVDHFLGMGAEGQTLSGVLFPESYGGLDEIEAIGRTMRSGKPQPLFSNAGRNFGDVKLLSLSVSHEKIGPGDRVIHATYDLKVSQYGSGTDRNPLLSDARSGGLEQLGTLF